MYMKCFRSFHNISEELSLLSWPCYLTNAFMVCVEFTVISLDHCTSTTALLEEVCGHLLVDNIVCQLVDIFFICGYKFIQKYSRFSWLVWFMVFKATFYNISGISWRSVLLGEETRGPGDNHRPVASY